MTVVSVYVVIKSFQQLSDWHSFMYVLHGLLHIYCFLPRLFSIIIVQIIPYPKSRYYETRIKLDENCALLRSYAAISANLLPTFWDNLSIPSSRGRESRKNKTNNDNAVITCGWTESEAQMFIRGMAANSGLCI